MPSQISNDLRTFSRLVEKYDTQDHAGFQQAIELFLQLCPPYAILQLGNKLGVGRSTMARWAAGTAAPHPAMRKCVYLELAKVFERKEFNDGVLSA